MLVSFSTPYLSVTHIPLFPHSFLSHLTYRLQQVDIGCVNAWLVEKGLGKYRDNKRVDDKGEHCQ